MRVAILVMIAILLTGCRSKKVITSVNTEREIAHESAIKKTDSEVQKEEDKQQLKRVEILEQKKEFQADFEVKGKAEGGKPIEIYNIQNGDTLQAIKVNGNAEVHIKTKTSNSDLTKKESTSESIIGKFKEFSENIVADNNIKERVRDVKNKTKEVQVNGFQAGLWIVLAVFGVVAIIIFGIYKYLKRKK